MFIGTFSLSRFINNLTLTPRLFRAPTPGDEAGQGREDPDTVKQSSAQEAKQKIRRLQTVIVWAEHMGGLDISGTMNTIQELQQKNEIPEDPLQ